MITQTASRVRADKGICRSAQRANKHSKQWTDCALSVLRLYLVKHRHQPFICEDIVEFARDRIDAAPDNRAWGHVIQQALRDKLIRRTGTYRKARSSNLSPKPVWVAA